MLRIDCRVMKRRILVITNFSNASQNALSYACGLFGTDQHEFLLAHIYALPLTYTVEGVALASVSEAFRDIEEQLADELDRIRAQFPGIGISGQYILGGLLASSRELIAAYAPSALVFGTAGYYSELWHTDSELLLALRNLTVPVVIVPEHIGFRAVQQIGFACDYRNVCVPKQTAFIRDLVHDTGGQLHIVHVARSKPDSVSVKQQNEQLLREALQGIEPHYHELETPEVFRAIHEFVRSYELDLLIVIPRKQEFWYSIFHKSNIRQLAFLNRLPIVALPV